MKPLLVLISVFILSLFLSASFFDGYNFSYAGCIAMSAMLLFTAIGHFAFAKGMRNMLPPCLPYKKQIVWATGMLEILAAAAIVAPATKYTGGWFLILFFIAVLPANIYAAKNNVDYQHPQQHGNGPAYLWFRIPLQCLFIFWVYFFIIKNR